MQEKEIKYTVYMMVGIPASGKSYIAKKLCDQNRTLKYVSRDEIRLKVTGSSKVDMEKEGDILKAFCSCIVDKFEDNCIIFADATHSSPRSRFTFLKTLWSIASERGINKNKIEVIPFVIETPFEICYKRNAKRPAETAAPDKDMKEYYMKCQYPSKEEIGFEKCFPVRLYYDPAKDKFQKIIFEDNNL